MSNAIAQRPNPDHRSDDRREAADLRAVGTRRRGRQQPATHSAGPFRPRRFRAVVGTDGSTNPLSFAGPSYPPTIPMFPAGSRVQAIVRL